MDQSQKQVRPGFLLCSLMIFAACGWLLSTGVPTEKDKIKAKTLETKMRELLISERLCEQATKLGGLKSLESGFIAASFQETNRVHFVFETDTNSSGQLLDNWQTPFEIKLAGATNFSIRSAGPDHKFGDEDDIVFNSATNNSVKQ